jgi:tRNA1Val (adenine37-N6)-methyltransferase
MIVRADRLDEALRALPSYGVSAFPLWPKPEAPAKRVLIHLQLGKHTPFTLLPGLVLHEENGRYTPEADAVLRHGAPLVIGESRR